jgi:hydrogenase nickel incorporation protein HypA/HybF
MHESSLMKGLIGRIDAAARENGLQRVTAVEVWLGALSQISEGHFREHFEHATPGTVAEGAQLSVELSDDITSPNAAHILLRRVDGDG